jgi:hypothetical protein
MIPDGVPVTHSGHSSGRQSARSSVSRWYEAATVAAAGADLRGDELSDERAARQRPADQLRPSRRRTLGQGRRQSSRVPGVDKQAVGIEPEVAVMVGLATEMPALRGDRGEQPALDLAQQGLQRSAP